MFQPGTLNGDRQSADLPAAEALQSRPQQPGAERRRSRGIPTSPAGWLGKLLGQSVYRANFGVNYYDEGLINFQTAAGNGPGLSQTLALPPFTPGSLNLQTALPAYTRTPTDFAFPIAMSGFTFNRGHATIDPDIHTPYVQNWTIGYQRELWRDSALEIRYVGNRGSNLWRSFNINETNIIENGFLAGVQERAAQPRRSTWRTAARDLPTRACLDKSRCRSSTAAFGPRGSVPAVPASKRIHQRHVRHPASAGTGRTSGEHARRTTSVTCARWWATPCRAARSPRLQRTGAVSDQRLPSQPVRRRPEHAPADRRGLVEVRLPPDPVPQALQPGRQPDGELHLRQSRTDRYIVGADGQQNYHTLRDKGLDWGPTAYDLRHTFQAYGTYDLPFGKDRHFSIDNALLDHIVGGWSASGIVRIQTGRPFLLTSGRQTLNQEDAGVVLNGITRRRSSSP